MVTVTMKNLINNTIQTRIYRENNTIFENWKYELPSGDIVHFPDRTSLLNNSKSYAEEFSVVERPNISTPTLFNIIEGDVIETAKSLIEQGLNPAVLSFANGYYPCGLYEEGGMSREEHLCRTTTLSLHLNLMSQQHPSAYPMNLNFGGIYSKTLVFREGKDYHLSDTPWLLPIISVPALNLRGSYHHKKVVRNLEYAVHGEESMTEEGKAIMQNKARTIFRIAVDNGHDSIILGAWGCGVYKQRPALIAQMFKQVLNELEFRHKFKEVHSVIEDHKQYVQYVRGVEGNKRFKCNDRPAYFCFKVEEYNIWGAEYPGDHNEKLAKEKILYALEFGITHFIDLTEEGELPPYSHLLPKDGSVNYIHFPIKDAHAPKSVEEVDQLLIKMEDILANPHNKIYLHCWGGVGRTGTISACWIARKFSLNYCIVMSRLQAVWKTCLKSYSQPIPDHWSQKEFIKTYITYLSHQKMIAPVKLIFKKMLMDNRESFPKLDDTAIANITYRLLYEKYVEGGYVTLWSNIHHNAKELHFIQQLIRNEGETKTLLLQILQLYHQKGN